MQKNTSQIRVHKRHPISFSKFKMIKSYLRLTINDDRHLALSINRDYIQKLDFEDIITDFASAKAQKVQF